MCSAVEVYLAVLNLENSSRRELEKNKWGKNTRQSGKKSGRVKEATKLKHQTSNPNQRQKYTEGEGKASKSLVLDSYWKCQRSKFKFKENALLKTTAFEQSVHLEIIYHK